MSEAADEIRELLADEIGHEVAAPFRALAEAVRQRHEPAGLGLLFYGSCLRSGEDRDHVVDLYLIVEGYGAVEVSPRVIEQPVKLSDLPATALALLGIDEPLGTGQDLGPLLRGEPSPRKTWLYPTAGVAYRSGKYKIHLLTKVRSGNPDTRKREPSAKHDPPLLFDLSQDIGEQKNIAAEKPQVVQRLLQEMDAYRKAGP